MAESVVFDHELTPTQVRNIREATGVEVYDRPAIILEIFHRHARSKEAQLQVELARLKYLAPRERVSGAKERRGGGRGARGVSESFHEIERRRHREGLPKVAIVGYTNAGKSSLMRALTLSEVLVSNRLFATLDTTVRALHPETQPRILVSDTVGFIRNLPHDLVASFRSTLDEALDASLLHPRSGCGRSGVPLSHSGDERSARRHWGGKASVSGDPKQDRPRRFFAEGFAGERVPRGHCDVLNSVDRRRRAVARLRAELSPFVCNQSSSQRRYANCRAGPRLQKVEPVSHPKAFAFEIRRVGRPCLEEGAVAFVYTTVRLKVPRRYFRTHVRITHNRKLSDRPSDWYRQTR